MAYGMFTSMKISLNNQIFLLQQKLNNITEQKLSMLTFCANIADGKVSIEDLASDPTNFQNYGDFVQSYNAWKQTSDAEGGCATTTGSIAGMATDYNDSEAYIAAISEMMETSVSQEYVKMYQKQLDAQEQQLDNEQDKIQTKITALQKRLEKVEEAEAKAIDKSTPKYTGLG